MNTKIIFLALMIVFSSSSVLFGQGTSKVLIYKGNKKFDANDYDGASSKFMEAIESNPKDLTAHYNLGNALYKKKMYEEAREEYLKAEKLSHNSSDKAAVLHNLGNTMMQMNQPDKAADYYKQSLKQDPYSEATRKNYEIAKLKQQEKQKNNSRKENESGKNGGGEDQKKGEKGDSKTQKKNQGDGPQQDQGKNDQSKGKDGGRTLPKEVEKAILDSIEGREKKTAKRIINKGSYSKPQSNEKDW